MQVVGRLIGPNGTQHREMQVMTGCTIVILDKEAPPGQTEDARLHLRTLTDAERIEHHTPLPTYANQR